MKASRLLLAAAGAALLVAVATAAGAHGPTVKVSYSGVRPERLVVTTGSTVHFHNDNVGGGPCTVVGEGEAFESPTLAPREGWHFTFESAGTYAFRIKELSGVAGTIVVGDP